MTPAGLLTYPSPAAPSHIWMQWHSVRIHRELQQRVLSPICTAFPHWLNLFLVPKPDTKIKDIVIAWIGFNIKFLDNFPFLLIQKVFRFGKLLRHDSCGKYSFFFITNLKKKDSCVSISSLISLINGIHAFIEIEKDR